MSGLPGLLAGLLLLAVGSAAVTRLLRPTGRLDAAITGGVVAVLLASGAVLAAGLPGALRPGALLLVHALAAGGAVAVLVRRDGWVALTLPRLPGPSELLRRARGAPWESAVVAAAALALGWQLVVALVLPPFAYDALTYHLTTVATWVRTQSLAPTDLSLCCAYYPLNADLPTAWTVVLLGRDALVGTVQVAAAVLGGLAVAGIGRSAGLRSRSAAAAGALFVLTPALLAQSPTPYVDVLLAALVLAALHGLVSFAADARVARLAVPATAAALLAGTKGTGPLWSVALFVTAAVLCGRHVRGRRLSGSRALAVLSGTAGLCLLLGAWWYARSLADTGNPLHPFELRLAGRTVFDGPLRVSDVLTAPDVAGPRPVAVLRSWAADLLPWRPGPYDYQQRTGGLGPLWAWLGAPLLVVAVVRLARARSTALVAVVAVVAVLAVQPYAWWARFTLPLAALGAVAVVLVLDALRPRVLRVALRTAVTGLALAGAALVLVQVDPASRAAPVRADRVLALAGAPAAERTVGQLFLPEYRFVSQLPEDAVVVVDLEADPVRFVYPLFGPRLTREVLPAGAGPVPPGAWVVTAAGRPLDSAMARTRQGPVWAEGGIRVWAPE